MSILSVFKGKHTIDKVNTQGKHLFSKFKMNDSVHVIHDHIIRTGKIVRIDGSVRLNGSMVTYTLELLDIKEFVQLPESLCFESKEALIESLK